MITINRLLISASEWDGFEILINIYSIAIMATGKCWFALFFSWWVWCPAHYEAAKLEGANFRQRFYRITLP
jgi:hypothetical protein